MMKKGAFKKEDNKRKKCDNLGANEKEQLRKC